MQADAAADTRQPRLLAAVEAITYGALVERRLLLRTTDLLEVERALDALEAAGVEACDRVDANVAGILGSSGQEFLIEVAADDLTKAAAALDQIRGESDLAAATPGSIDEKPPQLDPVAIAAWRLASKAALGSSVALLVLGSLLTDQTQPFQVFGSAVFDFLIWRGFTSDDLTEPRAKRLRSFGLMRGIGGLVVSLLFLSTGGAFIWLAAGAQALILALYSHAPARIGASQAAEPTRS